MLARALDELVRTHRAHVLGALIRHCRGDFARAEECVQDALAEALTRWPQDGLPAEPRAWLITVAKRKAIDLGRRAKLAAAHAAIDVEADAPDSSAGDDRLPLLFTCCHPALAREAQVALTLRTVAGLSTEAIARAFLIDVPTMAQRLVRAKTKIKAAGIPFAVPSVDELPARWEAVVEVCYLVFTEGYAATAGDALVRRELCHQAQQLALLLEQLVERAATQTAGTPVASFWRHFGRSQALGLSALMALHDARRDTRLDATGDLVLLEAQDRTRWDHTQIQAALPKVEAALRAGATSYAIQAAIAALHAQAARADATDWPQIALLYGALRARTDSPVVALNHAVAVAMVEGPMAGLALCAPLAESLDGYHLFHAARADLWRRLGETIAAREAYARALDLAGTAAEQRFLQRRLDALT